MKTVVSEGYKKTKVGVIPNDWQLYRTDKVLKRVRNTVDVIADEEYKQIGIRSHGKGIFYKETVSGKELGNKSVFWIEPDCFIVNIVFAWEQAIGKTTENEVGMIASHRFPMYKPANKVDLDYIVYLFKSKRGKYLLELASPGGAGRNKTLGQGEFAELEIALPPFKEQQKIVNILTIFDESIVKQDELIKEKEHLKKGLMQKLLSGKVRFDGFNDVWEEVKINQIFEITRGYVLAVTEMSQKQTEDYKYPVYSSQTKNNGLTGYYKDYLFENCITWTTDGANAGDVNLRKDRFYCTNVCGVLKSDKGYANQCIAEILNLVTKNYVSYVGNPKLMNNTMGGIKIKMPKSILEQQKIAEVLSLADDEINLLKNELEELKLQKKALMQKLLTGQVRVKV